MTQQDHTMQRDCRHFLLLLNSPKPCDKIGIISKPTFPLLRLRTSFPRLRELNLLSCLSDGLDRLVHCLETESLCAIFDSSRDAAAAAAVWLATSTQPVPPSANVARNDSDSRAVVRATAQKSRGEQQPHEQPHATKV